MKARIPKHREFIIDFPKEVSQEKADEGCRKGFCTHKNIPCISKDMQ